MKSFLATALIIGLVAAAPAPQDPDTPSPTTSTSSPSASASRTCRTVQFTVNGSAQNRNLTGIPFNKGVEGLRTFYRNAPFINVSGPQTIAGTYCTPSTSTSNNDKLQVYFHSIQSNRESWQALGGVGTNYTAFDEAKYSWSLYANNLGYPTLAIDRVGNGVSSHPVDALNILQPPYESALYSDLARQLRTTNTQFRTYSNLIYVGNSYGSQLGCAVAGRFPDAFTTFVLTGFTLDPESFNGTSLFNSSQANQQPEPQFRGLPNAYLTATIESAYINSFFGSPQQVSFDPTVADLDYKRRDVVSPGQFASVYAFNFTGAGFTGRVLTLDGEQDQAFCGPGSPVIGPASCGTLPARTGALFPNADYNWKTVNKTGHAIQLFNSAQTVFGVAHLFLAGASLKGGAPVNP